MGSAGGCAGQAGGSARGPSVPGRGEQGSGGRDGCGSCAGVADVWPSTRLWVSRLRLVRGSGVRPGVAEDGRPGARRARAASSARPALHHLRGPLPGTRARSARVPLAEPGSGGSCAGAARPLSASDLDFGHVPDPRHRQLRLVRLQHRPVSGPARRRGRRPAQRRPEVRPGRLARGLRRRPPLARPRRPRGRRRLRRRHPGRRRRPAGLRRLPRPAGHGRRLRRRRHPRSAAAPRQDERHHP